MKSKQITSYILRHFLRALPLVPGDLAVDIIDELKRSRTSIDLKIQKVHDSLQETSKVIKELETELSERTENLKQLQSEYERYSSLTVIEEEKASALLNQVELSLGKGKKSERWIGFWISTISGFIIFVAGLLLSPFLNPLILKFFNIDK